MSTWKMPERLVWHTVVCSQCGRVITRARLPGLQRVVSYRICDKCTAAGAPARRAARPRRSAAAPAEEAATS